MTEVVEDLSDFKVLIVEDHGDARVMIKTMLSELNVTQAFEANDGKQALDFMSSAFDFVNLIICDWNMPKMTGWSSCGKSEPLMRRCRF